MKIIQNVGLLALLTIISISSANAQKVVGYAPSYRTFGEKFDFSLYTHVHYFTLEGNSSGDLIWKRPKEKVRTQFESLRDRAKAAGAKVIITFGGTSHGGSKHFPALASDPVSRQNFVNQVLDVVLDWEADGIDIDWEWAYRPATEEHQNAYVNLMKDLRLEADKHGLSLSTAVSPSAFNGQNTRLEVLEYSDYVNVMTYSYSGAWSKIAKHHTSMNDSTNIGVQYWLNQGAAKDKLNMGSGFFARLYKGTTAPGTSYDKQVVLTRAEVSRKLNNGFYTVVEDNLNGTYAYTEEDDNILFYDSVANVTAKMNYTINNGLDGVVIWEMGQDDAQQTLARALNAANIDEGELLNADIDRNGAVDMKDIALFTRMLRTPNSLAAKYDFNYDNKVDRRDVRSMMSLCNLSRCKIANKGNK